MAKKQLVDSILKLYSKLGGNVSEVLGTRSNISFLGTGKSPEGFIDSTINIDAIGALGKNKVLDELKSSMGYLTANKLNDVQAGKLYENMLKIDNVFNPDIAAPVQQFSNEIDALETMTKNKAGHEFITAYVDDIYKNAGVTASVDVAKKRGAAREFLFTMLKKETDLLPQGGTLESVISPQDYKFIMEGGGGALGDPLILVKKYFGDTIVKRLPLNSDKEVIDTFVENVRFTKDRAGFPNDDPRFNPDDLPEFKHGGLAKILEV